MIDRLGQERRPHGLLVSRLPALLPLLAALAGGFLGLTMSIDGGLEEVDESFRAVASCCLRRSFSSRSC